MTHFSPPVIGNVLNGRSNPAVLWQAALGNVEIGHNLQTGDDCRVHLWGRRLLLEQDSIDAAPDAHRALAGLDVDVAGAFLDSRGYQEVHVTNDRRLTGAPLQVGDLLDLLLGHHLHGVLGDIFYDLVHLQRGAGR